MAVPKMSWYKVAESAAEIAWQNNQMAVVQAGPKKITLVKFNNDLFAVAFSCPHAGGIISDGFVTATGQVVCPLHRYRFDVQNGRNTSGEGYYLPHYRVDIREDGIYVGWEEKGFRLFG